MTKPITSFDGPHAFLSNFTPNTQGFNVEIEFQAAKAVTPADAARVRASATPGKAKWLGRRIDLRPDWNDIRIAKMLELVRVKFKDPAFAQRLMATGDAELIEGNTWNDRFWGVCKGVGTNHLGIILMQVRQELRDATTSR